MARRWIGPTLNRPSLITERSDKFTWYVRGNKPVKLEMCS